MAVSDEKLEMIKALSTFERRIEDMHVAFQKYRIGQEATMPEWQKLEEELLNFSRRKIYEVVISKNLDRLLFKFQTRKRLWLNWAEEFQGTG
jgi:hypothetical protein